jgi:hypothetical protein
VPLGSRIWSKWWWLRIDQIGAWSADERRAFGVFLLAWVVTALPFAIFGWVGLLRLTPINSAGASLISIFVALLANFPGVRRLASSQFPEIIIKGDDASAARMGGQVYLPSNERWIRGSWWLNSIGLVSDWSPEQKTVRARIYGIALFVFTPSFAWLASLLTPYFASKGLAAAISLLVTAPSALLLAHSIAKSQWPDLVKIRR